MADITVLSDDEFEGPVRMPIGWNYQNANKSILMGKKINGLNSKYTKTTMKRVPSSDEIEILEVVDIKYSSKPKVLLPASSTRSQIKSLTRNCKQSSIKKFIRDDKNKAIPKSKYNKFNSNSTCVKSNNDCNSSKSSTGILTNGNTPIHNLKNTNNVYNDAEFVKKEVGKDNIPSCPIIQMEILEPEECNNEINSCSKVLTEESVNYSITEDKKVNLPLAQNRVDIIPVISIASDGHEKTGDIEITSENSRSLFEMFIERWKSIPGYGGDDYIIKDKLWKLYDTCHSTYILSRKFANGIKKAAESINQKNRYVILKDIKDSMKNYKDTPYVEKKKILHSPDEKVDEEVVSKEEKAKFEKLGQLEKAMNKIHKRIQVLEEADCDLDDEDNSNYLLLDRLKTHFMKLDDKYCRIANYSPATGRPVEKKFKYEGSRYPEINKRISAWVNKHREFPDYTDVLNLVKNVTKDGNLPLIRETVRVQAQEIFRDVGKILKSRRQKDDMFSIYAYAGEEFTVDPADTDAELHNKLKINEKAAKENLNKIFHHFVEKEIEQRELNDQMKEPKRCKDSDEKDDILKESSPVKQDKLEKRYILGESTCKEEQHQEVDKNKESCDEDKEMVNKDKEMVEDKEMVKKDKEMVDSNEEMKVGKDEKSVNKVKEFAEKEKELADEGNEPKLKMVNEDCSASKILKYNDDDSHIGLCEAGETEMTQVDEINEISSDSSDTQSSDICYPLENDDIEEVTPESELELQKNALDLISSEKHNMKTEYIEEDIVIADSPSPDDGNESDLEIPLNQNCINNLKRKWTSPIQLAKRRYLSSPEVVELD